MEQRLRAQFKRLARYSKGCSRSILLLAFVVVVSGGGLTQAQTSSSGGYMVSASPTTVAPGGTVTVPWQAPSNHSSRDWIGLFRVGTVSSGATVLGWKYVPSGTSGMMTFAVPNITAQYEVRYLLNDQFVQAAVSGPITVTTTATSTAPPPSSTPTGATYGVTVSPTTVAPGGSIVASWRAPTNHSSRDWIGLFRVGAVSSGATVLGWKYVPSGTSGMMTFAVPNITAQYEVRYLLNDKFVQAAVSGPVTVTTAAGGPSPSPTAGSATLTWTLSRDTDVAGYRIYRGTRSGEYGAPLAVVTGPVTSYQATGLQPNTTYYFVVTAYDHANNESVVSNEVSKSVY